MSEKIEIITANHSNFEKFKQLCASYFDKDDVVFEESHFSWFYLNNPAGSAKMVVASESGAWLGIIVLIPIILEQDGEQLIAYFAINVLTHPDHRKKNLFIKLIRCAREELEKKGHWLLGHPNKNALPFWKRQKMEFRQPLHVFLTKFHLPFSGYKEFKITKLEQLRLLPESFWINLSKRKHVHVKYTPEFINWRYLNGPHHKYTVTGVRKNNTFVGLRITRPYRGPINLLVDYIGPEKVLYSLLRSFYRPTILLHPKDESTLDQVSMNTWELPTGREVPFFVTTWQTSTTETTMKDITLAASDF